MVGDVVGDPGLEVLERQLPLLIKEKSVDFAIVNGENAAGGFGLTSPLLERILAAGADVVTGGNHIWEKREFWPGLDAEQRVIRPMNYPVEAGSPGRGWILLEKPSPWGAGNEAPLIPWVAVNLQGREFMSTLDCPFRSFDAFEARLAAQNAEEKSFTGKPLILVDFHAESTREKEALAYYLDGRVTVLAGTHTHIQTADERLLPLGSAYITDLGMTGTQDGVIGMDRKICINRARNQVLYRMEVAAATEGKTAVQGIVVEIDYETAKPLSIERFSLH